MRNYESWSTIDFIMDKSFQDFVFQEGNHGDLFWEKFPDLYPSNIHNYNEAKLFLEGILSSETDLSERRRHLSQVWWEIDRSISVTSTGLSDPKKLRARNVWYKVAAAAIVLMTAVSISVLIPGRWWSSTTVITTGYGQEMTVPLPDGSVVMLNSNSSLSFKDDWDSDETREVEFSGQGFFKVSKHKSDGQPVKFIVHVDQLSIEVLGTEFNVTKKSNGTQVVLREGSVRLRLSSGSNDSSIYMVPGQLVMIDEDRRVETKNVMVDDYTSWLNKRLVFNDTPLSEVAEIIEQNYGKKVIFDDPKQMSRKISGVIKSDDLSVLIKALSRTFNLSVTLDGDVVRISEQIIDNENPN